MENESIIFKNCVIITDINKLNFHQRDQSSQANHRLQHGKMINTWEEWRGKKLEWRRARRTALESWILAGMSWQTARLGHLSRPVSSGKCESLRRRPGKFLASIQGRGGYERRRNRKMGLDLVRSCPQAGFITRMLDLLVCSS